METSSLENRYLGSVTCRTCNMHHTIDKNGECEFCRNKRIATDSRTEKKFSDRQILLTAIVVFGLIGAALWFIGGLWKAQ